MGRAITCENSLFVDNPGLGSISDSGNVWGSYLHGIFDSDIFRRFLLNKVREKKGLKPLPDTHPYNMLSEFDRLEAVMRENLNLKIIGEILWQNI